jgi:indole-3-glycerol phosphate synthase
MSAGFLAEIVAETRRSIREPAYWADLPAEPGTSAPSLRGSIERDRGRGALIVEYKRISPGAAEPRLPARSVEAFGRAVGPASPSGFSCLASIPRFEGRPGDVAALRHSTDLPILFKEFVIDPVQLDAARRAGASAVLLIARLGTSDLRPRVPIGELARAAHDRGLEVLLEFHALGELKLADDVEADMYGVNVRDLDTLRIDRPTAEATLAAAADRRPLLGLSGIDGPPEARWFWDRDADGILIGSAVARSADPVAFLESLRRSPREAAA